MRKGIEVRESSPDKGQNNQLARVDGIEKPRRVPLSEAQNLTPRKPGVYRFWDNNDRVLYVGKAKILKNRIASHLLHPDESPRHKLIIERSTSIDWVVTPNEVEALLLEDSLIKRHKPVFNVKFRDDKRYPIIRLDVADDFPTISVVRRFEKDGALYFGPYTSSRIMRTILRVIERYFPLRRCKGKLSFENQRECLNYQIHKCPGVCNGKTTKEEYSRIVKEVQLLLSGRNDELIHNLELEMRNYSEKLNFEAAAIRRDQLKAVKNISGGRRLLLPKPVDIDVFAFGKNNDSIYSDILLVRAGMIAGDVKMRMDTNYDIDFEEISERFLTHYYGKGALIPGSILVSHKLESQQLLSDFFKKISGKRIEISVPQKGIHASLLRLAKTNLKLYIQTDSKIRVKDSGAIALKELLELEEIPIRIEAIDISENQGKFAVGSVISFLNGKPQRDRYRRFRIKSDDAHSDLDRIREVFNRRLKRRSSTKWSLPDVFLIDGGKLQLQTALEVAQGHNLSNFPIISLAKARNNRMKEGIFLPDGREIQPDSSSPLIRYLDTIRDEAHRFAITYHRELRERSFLRSKLRDIPGIGFKKRTDLLNHFFTIENILKADISHLTKVPGIGVKTAEIILKFFKTEKDKKNPDIKTY